MIKFLLKYFKSSERNLNPPKMDLMSSTEALKQFAWLWKHYKADTMTMMAVLEYEFINNNNFSDKEISAVKSVLGHLALYLGDCEKEYDTMLAKQVEKDL